MNSTAELVEGCFQSIVDNGGRYGLALDLPGNEGEQDVAPTALEPALKALSGSTSTIWALVVKNPGITRRTSAGEVDAEQRGAKR